MPISKEELKELSKIDDDKIIKILESISNNIDSSQSLELISEKLQDIHKTINDKNLNFDLKINQDSNDILIDILSKINQSIKSKSSNDNSELISNMIELINELLLQNKNIFLILEELKSNKDLKNLTKELSDIKIYLNKNLEAEWQFDIYRNLQNKEIEEVKVKRIK